MKKVLGLVLLIPLAVILIAFAIANRHVVTVYLDPFDGDPGAGIRLPLFAVMVLCAIVGVIAGGIGAWLRQGRWRRAARRNASEARAAQTELASLREHMEPAPAPLYRMLPGVSNSPALPAHGERDKRDTAL